MNFIYLVAFKVVPVILVEMICSHPPSRLTSHVSGDYSSTGSREVLELINFKCFYKNACNLQN